MMEGTEQAAAVTAKRRNVLPRMLTRKAMDWLEANRAEVGARPRTEIAQILERYLDHPVTVRNLESLARDTVVELHQPQPKPETPCRTLAQLLTRMTRNEEEKGQLLTRMTRLEDLVEKLSRPLLPAVLQVCGKEV